MSTTRLPRDLVTGRDLAAQLTSDNGDHRWAQRLRKWRERRLGPPYYRLGGQAWYSHAEVNDWVAGQQINPSGMAEDR